MSQEVALVVTNSETGNGGCADAVPYVAGTRYEVGALVSNLNQNIVVTLRVGVRPMQHGPTSQVKACTGKMLGLA